MRENAKRFILARDKISQKFDPESEYNRFKSDSKSDNLSDFKYTPPGKVIVITGPTATGKSALAVKLCLETGGEVVSADSMQVYRGMDVGTAKISPEEMEGVPHHMIDVCSPKEMYSVSRYTEEAERCLEDIFSRGKTPVLVGGTGLYIDSLLSGRSFAPRPENGELRSRLEAEYDAAGGEAFREKLRIMDPLRAEKLHSGDKKRLVRACEIFLLTGETITEHDLRTQAEPCRWPSVRFALTYEDREMLYRRIETRVDRMFADGLAEETAALLKSGVPKDSTAMQAIGYKETAEYLSGAISLAEAADAIKTASRRYAKRQLTWLRRDRELHWITWAGEEPQLDQALQEIYRTLREI